MKIIGIIGDKDTYRRNENYYAAAEAAGAKTLPFLPEDGIARVKEIDGLIIPGGDDINPALYHEENHGSIDIDDALDAFEMVVLSETVKQRKAILGICRGHQLLNVYFGGTLIQHLENYPAHVWIDKDTDNAHSARVEKGTFFYEIYGTERIGINSAHHQAVKRIGSGLRPALWSDSGVLEAMYHESLPIFGVQFHPERMCLKNKRDDTVDGLKIFEYFLRHC